MRQMETIAVQISTWLRTAFEQLVGSESPSLMGINDLGEFKAYAVERFKRMLQMAVKTSLRTNSPIPSWASDRVIEAWNIPV